MKYWAVYIASLIVCIFDSYVSTVCSFQMYTTHHHEERRRPHVRTEEPFFEQNTNWSISENQRVPVTTLDVNRDYSQIPNGSPPYPLNRPENKQNSSRRKRQNCIFNFCEEVENYPETLIKRVLGNTKSLDAYFKQAEVTVVVNNRGAFDEEEDTTDTMCPVKSITLYPKSARNTKDEERFLVNVEGHRQGIVFETCLENATCRFSDAFPVGYTSYCKQKYVRRSLAVLDAANQTTAWDTFEVPSCCVCVVKRE